MDAQQNRHLRNLLEQDSQTVSRRLSTPVRHDSTWVAATWWLQRIELDGRVMALGHEHPATDLNSRRRPQLPVGTAAFIELLHDPAKPRGDTAISGGNGVISFLFAPGNRRRFRKGMAAVLTVRIAPK